MMAKLLRIAVVSMLALMSHAQSAWAICDAEYNAAMEVNKGLKYSDDYSGSIRRNQQEWSSGRGMESWTGEFIRQQIARLSQNISGHERNRNATTSSYEKAAITGKIKLNEHTLCWSRYRQQSDNQAGASSDTTTKNSNVVTDTSSQQAQQSSQQQSQQTAQQNQARADKAREGKRKTHDPAAEAHECIAIDKAGSGNYGAFKNQCPYPVNFTTCNEKPRIIQGGFNWSADFDCAKQQFGLHTPKGNSSVAAHNRNTEFVYWFACKAPAMPVDATYAAGKGIEARCHN